MKTQAHKILNQESHIFSLRENQVFSWRFIAVLSLMGCIAVEVLFNLLPVDHDTLILYWFFPASLLLVSQLYFGLRFTQQAEIKFLLIFFVWGCATVILNYGRAQLVDSYEWFASICTTQFLCFSLPYAFKKDDARRVLRMLALATLIAAAILCVVSLIAVFVKNIAVKMPSVFEGIGIEGGRLSIDNHPNRSAPAPALGVILAGILLVDTKKMWWRMLIVLGAIVCFIPLALTDSRTAIIGAGLAVAFETSLSFHQTFKDRISSTLRISLALLVAVVVAVSFYKVSTLTRQLCNTALVREETTVASMQDSLETGMMEETSTSSQPAANEPIVVEGTSEGTAPTAVVTEKVITRDFSDAGSFNGRTEIWRGVWNGIKENPKIFLIGTGPEIASEVMSPYFPLKSPIGIFHNSLVGALVSYGLPGVILSLAFLAMAALASIRLVFGKTADQPLAVRLLPAVMLFAVAESMMEDFLFTSTTLNIVWIWFMIAAGSIFRLGHQESKTNRLE